MKLAVTFPAEAQTTANTLLQLFAANANRPLEILEISFTMGDTSIPVFFEVVKQTDAGTDGTSVTPVLLDGTDPHTIETTALRKPDGSDWTADPTATDILWSGWVHAGFFWSSIKDGHIKIAGGDRLGVRIDAPAGSVSITGYIHAEE